MLSPMVARERSRSRTSSSPLASRYCTSNAGPGRPSPGAGAWVAASAAGRVPLARATGPGASDGAALGPSSATVVANARTHSSKPLAAASTTPARRRAASWPVVASTARPAASAAPADVNARQQGVDIGGRQLLHGVGGDPGDRQDGALDRLEHRLLRPLGRGPEAAHQVGG